MDFACKHINSWAEFYSFVLEQTSDKQEWVYRGHANKDWKLETTIERALRNWRIDLKDAAEIEFQTVREFRRRLRDPQYERAHNDTLYCLALMRHYAAPTRLLDCTYSPFVAAAFAMQDGPGKIPTIWCFRQKWLEDEAKQQSRLTKLLLEQRDHDRQRTDDTFLSLFQFLGTGSKPRARFVKAENAFHLNERLTAQQGVFLCPADVGSCFVENLIAMSGSNLNHNVVELQLHLNDPQAFARNLKNMNLSFAALFPGLDGFARSITQHIFHYHDIRRAGLPPLA